LGEEMVTVSFSALLSKALTSLREELPFCSIHPEQKRAKHKAIKNIHLIAQPEKLHRYNSFS